MVLCIEVSIELVLSPSFESRPNLLLYASYQGGNEAFLISQGTLPWQPIIVEKSAFFAEQSPLSHCHSKTDCNIAISISKY